jgi:hypothetical protein
MEQSALGISYVSTRRLSPLENGTRVGIYLGMPRETSSQEVRQMLQGAMDAGYAGLRSYIEKDVANGKITATS